MKLWHVAALLLVLGIGYVLISRPTVPTVNNQASSNNYLLGVIGAGINLTSKVFDKVTAPSASDLSSANTNYFTSSEAAADVFNVEPTTGKSGEANRGY